MRFIRQNEPTNEAQVKGFEVSKNLRFPKDYRAFLLEYNGGRPADANAFWQLDDLNLLSIEAIYGFTSDSLNSIKRDRFNNFSNSIHARLLQIAYTGSQNLYLDLREGPMHGKIYILARPANEALKVDDVGFEDEADYEEALFLHPVADSFSDFIDMLGPEPNEPQE